MPPNTIVLPKTTNQLLSFLQDPFQTSPQSQVTCNKSVLYGRKLSFPDLNGYPIIGDVSFCLLSLLIFVAWIPGLP